MRCAAICLWSGAPFGWDRRRDIVVRKRPDEKKHETVHHTQQRLGAALWDTFLQRRMARSDTSGVGYSWPSWHLKGVLTAIHQRSHLWSFWIESLFTFWTLVDLDSMWPAFDFVSGSWHWCCHGQFGHLDRKEPLLIILVTPVVFPNCDNVYF